MHNMNTPKYALFCHSSYVYISITAVSLRWTSYFLRYILVLLDLQEITDQTTNDTKYKQESIV